VEKTDRHSWQHPSDSRARDQLIRPLEITRLSWEIRTSLGLYRLGLQRRQRRHTRQTELMMAKEDQLRQILECGIVAVVRSPDSQQLVEVVRALADGGVTVAEITMTVANALD